MFQFAQEIETKRKITEKSPKNHRKTSICLNRKTDHFFIWRHHWENRIFVSPNPIYNNIRLQSTWKLSISFWKTQLSGTLVLKNEINIPKIDSNLLRIAIKEFFMWFEFEEWHKSAWRSLVVDWARNVVAIRKLETFQMFSRAWSKWHAIDIWKVFACCLLAARWTVNRSARFLNSFMCACRSVNLFNIMHGWRVSRA